MQTSKSDKGFNKQGYSYRWVMLMFCVWISMGNYYNYDIPTALRNSFKEYFSSMFSENQFEIYFALLHSISSFANMFTPFFSGKIRDKFGNRIALITLLCVVSLGQFLFIKGLFHFNIYYIVIGRILISVGIEPCCAIQTSLLSQYFKQDHITFATGLCELFATFGTITVLYLAPKLASNFGLIIAVQSGSLANIISILCCLIALIFDYHAEVSVHCYCNSQITAEEIQGEHSIFSRLYLILIVYYAILNSALLTFSNFSIGVLSERYFANNPDAEEKAAELMAIVWAVSAFLFPLFGLLIDRYQNRSKFNIAASILATSGIILVWYRVPFIAVNLLGVAFAILCSSVWSSIIFLVDYQHLGIAYAYLLSAGNLTLTVLPLGVSALRVHFQSYYYSLMLLGGLAFLTMIISIIIFYEDYENNALDGNQIDKKNTYSAIVQNDNEY